jgi:WD40 repeat protein
MKSWIILGALFLISCNENASKLEVINKFPKKISEVSGIQMMKNSNSVFAIEDSGNGSFLHIISLDGKEQEEVLITAENIDWEDLASDKDGNLYFGDFGNNDNKRKDLCIYKVGLPAIQDKTTLPLPEYKVSFYYPEQTEFPPSKKELLYDCEAFFERNGFFYLFTKNRSKGFDGTMLIYKVPNKEGNHAAQLLGKYKTGEDYNTGAITGAAMSPDGSKFVLLSHNKIWLFTDFKGDDFLNGMITQIELNHYSKKEAICFKDDNTLLIADEKDKKTGGNLYLLKL